MTRFYEPDLGTDPAQPVKNGSISSGRQIATTMCGSPTHRQARTFCGRSRSRWPFFLADLALHLTPPSGHGTQEISASVEGIVIDLRHHPLSGSLIKRKHVVFAMN